MIFGSIEDVGNWHLKIICFDRHQQRDDYVIYYLKKKYHQDKCDIEVHHWIELLLYDVFYLCDKIALLDGFYVFICLARIVK